METLSRGDRKSVQDLDGSQEPGILHVRKKAEPEASQVVTANG